MANSTIDNSTASNSVQTISSVQELEVSASDFDDMLSSFGSPPNEIAAHAELPDSCKEVNELDLDDMLATFSIPQAPISIPKENPAHDELSSSSTELSQFDINEMLASFGQPQAQTHGTLNPPFAGKNKEQRKTPRYIVNWRAIIVTDEKGTVHGLIKDISMSGASIYKEVSLPVVNCALHIQVSPLVIGSKPYVMVVDGKVIYSVYDGNKNLFRTAITFLKFHKKSDQDYLEERLTKHHVKIPEVTGY